MRGFTTQAQRQECNVRTFPVQAVIAARKALTDLDFEQLPFPFADITYPYFVIPTEWENAPRDILNFVFRMLPSTAEIRAAASPADVTLFGLSSDIPEPFRKYWLMHEIKAFINIGTEESGYYSATLAGEVKAIKADKLLTRGDQDLCLRLRHKFFQDQAEYARTHCFSADDIEEFECAQLDYARFL